MPPRKRQTAKTRNAAAAKAKAKAKKAEDEKVAEAVAEEEVTSELESQDASVVDDSQESSVVEAEEDTSVVEEQVEEAAGEEIADEEEEPAEVEEELAAEASTVEEDEEILEEGDVEEGGEEPGDEILEDDDDAGEGDVSEEVSQEVVELEEEEEPMEEQEGEEADEASAEQAEEEEEEETHEAEGDEEPKEGLFTIDKTPMDIQEVESKIVKEKKTDNKTKKVADPKKKSADKEKPADKEKSTDKEKPTDKASEKSKELPLKGRVLRVHPVRLKDLTMPSAAAILRQSIGYNIRSDGVKNSSRTLEIWFHSPQEGDEMFVKFCNFKWSANGRPSRVTRINDPQGVDATLKAWDQKVSPFGLYDGRCVFAGNLPADATEAQLLAEFDLARKCQIPTNKEGKSEGYALLEFSSNAEAIKQSKRKVKLGENELTLQNIGMKRVARSKDEQQKLDREMSRLRKEGINTDFAEKRPVKSQNTSGRSANQAKPQQSRGNQKSQSGQKPGQGNFRQGQGNRRPGQGNLRQGQGNRGNWNQKRRTSGGYEDSSPTKRGRTDRSRDRNPGRGGGLMGMMSNQEMQLRQEMLMAQQTMLAQQMAQQSGMGMSRGRMSGAGGRGGNDDLSNLRGELLGQMQNLQQGGMTDPAYLMALAQRLQQAQHGGGRL